MDAPALPPDEARELAALRARAYGPEGGIGVGDLARLQRLEAAAHAAAPRPTGGGAGLREEPRPSGRDRAGLEAESAAVSADDALGRRVPSAGGGDDRAPMRLRRRWAAVLAGSAVLAAVAMAWALGQFAGPSADAVLEQIPTDVETGRRAVHRGLVGEYGADALAIQQYEPFHSLSTWSASSDTGRRCLVIYAGDRGPVGRGCVPAGLDPVVDVTIWPGIPEEISQDLPPGSVIRYVLADDRVLVWVRRDTR